MPKLKTHKGTSKRVRVTKGGKLLRRNAATHHKLAHQTARSKRAKTVDSKIPVVSELRLLILRSTVPPAARFVAPWASNSSTNVCYTDQIKE